MGAEYRFISVVITLYFSHVTGRPCVTSTDMALIQERLTKFDGMGLTAFDARDEDPDISDWTVCIGFKLNRSYAEANFSEVLPGVSFEGVNNQSLNLSPEQCRLLLLNDLNNIYIPKAMDVAGDKFCVLPKSVKVAVLLAVRGGDFGSSDVIAGYIQSGQWCDAAEEYNEYDGYIYCQLLETQCERMDWCARQFGSMCKHEKRKKEK